MANYTDTNHLEHPFDDRLRIALWEPTLIKLGDIGYLTPGGGFCKIYNVSTAIL